MKLVAGLGNPGRRYAGSRHNVGFLVIDELARRWGLGTGDFEKRFQAVAWEAARAGDRVLLLQPQTYMNLSGQSVSAAWRYYKLALADVLVVYDDLDLPLGRLRVRPEGSAGGHRGMSDVIRHLGSDQIARVRVGIGKVDPSVTVDYVLSTFRPDEREEAEAMIRTAADSVECWLARGVAAAMNEFNRKRDG